MIVHERVEHIANHAKVVRATLELLLDVGEIGGRRIEPSRNEPGYVKSDLRTRL